MYQNIYQYFYDIFDISIKFKYYIYMWLLIFSSLVLAYPSALNRMLDFICFSIQQWNKNKNVKEFKFFFKIKNLNIIKITQNYDYI